MQKGPLERNVCSGCTINVEERLILDHSSVRAKHSRKSVWDIISRIPCCYWTQQNNLKFNEKSKRAQDKYIKINLSWCRF